MYSRPRLALALALTLAPSTALAQGPPSPPSPAAPPSPPFPATPPSPAAPPPASPPPAAAPPRPPEGSLPPGYPTSAPVPAPPLAAPAGAPPPAPGPPPAKKDEAPLLRVYALLKPTVVASSDAIESFGQPNASAATAAGNPVLTAVRNEAHYTFQAAQSRLGFWFAEKGPVRGQIEFDFIDFTKASPTVASVPRVEHLLLAAGQDWDLHAPINPHGINLVGGAFQAGNTGFMRQQVKFLYHTGAFEVAGAVGFPANNNGPKHNVPEYARTPTLAARAALLLGPAGRVGVSGIANRWRFTPDAPTERYAFAGAAGLFGDLSPLKALNLRFEGYAGRNVANLGLLGLGQGNAADDVDEAGGFVSIKYNVTEAHAVYAFGGTARALDPAKVAPSYAYASAPADGAAPAPSAATLAGTGPGLRWNRTARLGYEYRPSKAIAVLGEGFWFRTRHALNADFDAARFGAVRHAVGAELGLLFTM
ncbi:MAG: hypothetical protein MUF34_11840 [Polyangiaceae bacterium]|nr:hypothetical protein [Polyangiaceae bacterium]